MDSAYCWACAVVSGNADTFGQAMIYFLRDSFRKPSELRPDVILRIDDVMEQLIEALCSHESQFFSGWCLTRGLEQSSAAG